MAYEVTATRRRPQQFDDLVGQEFVAQTLKNSIKSGKIAHAYLFTGPRGCGKTSSARILAKALNCQNGPTERPCGECSNCKEIAKGTSLDVIEIDGASNTGVENVRQIKDEVLFPPSNSKYKIYIIDEVHMLSIAAFNALLKTIEEPPPHVVFVFATTELQKVPATIKSRCQQYNFRLVAVEKVKECLAQAALESNVQAQDEALFWIARESTGSMRDAYTLFDQIAAFSDGFITYDKIRDKLGLLGAERLNAIFELCCQNKTDGVFTLLDEFLQSGISIEQFAAVCADYLRSLLFIKSGVKKESLLGNAVSRYSVAVLEKWNLIQIERALSIFLQLYKDIRYSLSPRYELEVAFARLCWISEYVSNADVKKAIDAAQKLLISENNKNSGGAAGVLNGGGFENFSARTEDANAESFRNQNLAEKAPNGLPILKLSNRTQDDDDGASEVFDSVDVVEKSEARPFYDGGPLPPKQSAGAESQKQPDKKSSIIPTPQFSQTAWQNASQESFNAENPSSDTDFGDDEKQNFSYSSIQNAENQTERQEFGENIYSPRDNQIAGKNPAFRDNQSANDIQTSRDNQVADNNRVANDSLKILDNQSAENSRASENQNFFDDDYDREWASADEIPDDEYDDAQYQNFKNIGQKEKAESYLENKNAAKKEIPAQIQDKFKTADGAELSIAQLRGNVMAALSVKDGFAASNLQKTGVWRVLEDSVATSVQNQYDLDLIKKKLPAIEAEISAICGKKMKFLVDLQKEEKNQKEESARIPLQIEILLNVFKGTVVAGKV